MVITRSNKPAPFHGQKAQTSRGQYVESSITPFEGMGHYGAKPWPFDYRRAVNQYSGWVYRCVTGNANAAASVPLRLYVRKRSALQLKAAGMGPAAFESRRVSMARRKYLRGEFYGHQPSATVRHKLAEFGDDFEEVTDHPVLNLLRTVNPMLNGFDLTTFRHASNQLTGNSYLHPVMNHTLMRPEELWPMPADWTRIVPGKPDSGEMVESYVFGDGYTREQVFQPDEVLHFAVNRGLKDLHYGYGPMEAAWSTIGLSQSKRISDKALFDNMARPDYVLSIEGANQDQVERTESRINSLHRGVRRVGKSLVTSGRAKVQALQFPPKDVGEFAEILEELAGIFGYPIQKLKAAYEPKANAEVADYSWMKDTILPMLRHDEETLNQGGYLALFGDGALLDDAVLAYDDPVPANAEGDRNDTQVYVSTGVWTLNDRRADLGLPPVEGGDEPRINGVSLSALDAQAAAAAHAASQPFGSVMGPVSPAAHQTPAPAPDAGEIARQVAAMLAEAKATEQANKPDPRAKSLFIAKSLPYPMTRTKAATSPYQTNRTDGYHPALNARLTGTYTEDDDALPWIGWIEPDKGDWIGFLAEDGWLVVYDERDADGGVLGKPWTVIREDLLPGGDQPENVDADSGSKTATTRDKSESGVGPIQDSRPTIQTKAANLAKRIRERHKASAVMLMVNGDANDQAFQFTNYDLDPADIAPEGVEVEPHVTIKWGLKTDRFEDVAPALRMAQPVRVRFGKTAIFEAEQHDVVYVAVESEQLTALHKALGEIDNDEPERDYTPHMTLAYVTKGKGEQYAGRDDFDGFEAILHTVVFSASNGDASTMTLRRGPNNGSDGKTNDPDGEGTGDGAVAEKGAGDQSNPEPCSCKTYTPDDPEGDVAEAVKQHGPDAAYMPVSFKGYKALPLDDGEADDTARDGEAETPIQRMARLIAAAFTEQESAVLAALKATKAKARKTKADASDDDKLAAARKDPRIEAVLNALGVDVLAAAIERGLPPMIAAGAQTGADAIGMTPAEVTASTGDSGSGGDGGSSVSAPGDGNAPGMSIGFDVSNPLVEQAARERSIDLAGDLNQTTVNRLRDSLANGIAGGESSAQLTARVREQFASFTDTRAEAIARTESALAYETGQTAVWEDSGVVEGSKWLLAPGNCEFCAAIAKQYENKVVPLGESFVPKGSTIRGVNGGTMKAGYRDLKTPPAHPMCRCDLIPVLGGEFKALNEAIQKNDRPAITKFWKQRTDAGQADRGDQGDDQPGADGPAGVSG